MLLLRRIALPRMDDILDHLAGNSWFTLNLKSGYWQIEIRPWKIERKQRFLSGVVFGNLK